MSGNEIPPKDIFGFFVCFLIESEDLLFLLVHGPHSLQGETQSGHTVHGFEKVIVHIEFVLWVDGEVERCNTVVVASFISYLEEFSFRWVSYSG